MHNAGAVARPRTHKKTLFDDRVFKKGRRGSQTRAASGGTASAKSGFCLLAATQYTGTADQREPGAEQREGGRLRYGDQTVSVGQ